MSQDRVTETQTGLEQHSIDFIPESERHGKVWHQGPFWFTGGFVLPSMATGFIGPSLGLGMWWSIIAVILGMAFGTLFMAFHANQGPRLGLPQMIQSRAQFGIRGSVFPLLVGVFIYLGYNVFNLILAREAIATISVDTSWSYIVFTAVALAVAIYGYRLLHVIQRYLSYALVAVFIVFTILVIIHFHGAAPTVQGSGFDAKAFLVQFAAVGGYQISYAIYVSDYSRYLPVDVSAPKLILWTYAGATLGAAWMSCLGSVLASYVSEPEAVHSIEQVGNAVIPGFGTFAVLLSIPALVGTTAINMYGGMLTGTSIFDSFKRITPTVRLRIIGLSVMSLIALLVTFLIPSDYLESFNTFLTIMLYLLVPWTAVNLVDFYAVRHGHYVIQHLSKHDGIYGLWAWRGLTAYFAGFVAMIPFFALSFYTGPAAEALGGADISFIVGLLVSGVVYLLLSRQTDWQAELARAEASSPASEGATTVS
jgi:nucleobase:cation symporter-1, NCS1 family